MSPSRCDQATTLDRIRREFEETETACSASWFTISQLRISGPPAAEICSAVLDPRVADEVGLDCIALGEHHGSPGGYGPSPVAFLRQAWMGDPFDWRYGLGQDSVFYTTPLLCGLDPRVAWES